MEGDDSVRGVHRSDNSIIMVAIFANAQRG